MSKERQSRAIVAAIGFICLGIVVAWSMGKAPQARQPPLPLPAPARVIDIHEFDGGGMVEVYRVVYQMFERAGYSVRVDAECTSACVLAFAIFPPDRICVTEDAVLGMHLAFDLRTGKPDREYTARMLLKYPRWLQDATKALGRLEQKPKYITFDVLRKHVAVCAA